jgi:hypothetical protein
VAELERAVRTRPPGGADRRSGASQRWRDRRAQLRRIVALEEAILYHLPQSPSGVSALSPRQREEVIESVDAAVELTRTRVLLLRAIAANPLHEAQQGLEDAQRLRQSAGERLAGEVERLIALRRDQVQRIKRWREDQLLAELQLDQIETVLRQVAYDPMVTARDVGERLGRLHTGVRARRDSVQELEGRLGEALRAGME